MINLNKLLLKLMGILGRFKRPRRRRKVKRMPRWRASSLIQKKIFDSSKFKARRSSKARKKKKMR